MANLGAGSTGVFVKTAGKLMVGCCDCGVVDPPCSGQDPLCTDCPCEAGLADNYYVSISGFPAICDVDQFNGVWTLNWVSDCTWEYWIDAWRQVALTMSPGLTWTVHWSVAAPGGAGGYFLGSGGSVCAPETNTYASASCFNPFGCFGLCAGVAVGSIVVSR